jgi:hypothetical protein
MLAKTAAVALAICPQKSAAEGFTGKEFLTRSTADQRAFVSTQMVMASTISARIKPDHSACIGEVFFDNLGLSDRGFDTVMQRVREFQSYHPSSVMVIVVEQECGPFN